MGDYGLKISKSGYDIGTAAVKDQIFNTSANSLKIAMQGSASGTISKCSLDPYYSGGTIEVSHNLGYTPAFLVFCNFDGQTKWYTPYATELDSGDAIYTTGLEAGTEKLSIFFGCRNYDNSYVGKIYYYIFVDPGE